MSRILSKDKERAESYAEVVVEILETDIGLPPEEAIPALIEAIRTLANKTEDPDQALSEAANLL